MKQCSRCNALYPPRLSACPTCTAAAPQSWVRTKSRAKTREVNALPAAGLPKATRPAHHREDFAGRPRERSADQTLQITRDEVLAALRAEGLDLNVDETTEGPQQDLAAADLYDVVDDAEPARRDARETAGFVQFDSLEQLSDELFFSAPDSEADSSANGRTSAVRQLITRSREVAQRHNEVPHTDEIQMIEVFEQPPESGEFEAWVLDEVDALLLSQPEKQSQQATQPEVAQEKSATSSVTAWLTTFCLWGVAGWGFATEAPMPVVLALVVGGCVVALLSTRATSR